MVRNIVITDSEVVLTDMIQVMEVHVFKKMIRYDGHHVPIISPIVHK